jgi:hypothetical protein
MPDGDRVIEIIGEGKADSGPAARSAPIESPDRGVVPILVHRLCESPASMKVKRRPVAFLQGKGVWQKVRYAKRQAVYNGSAGLVFVTDTEGNHPGQLAELIRGRDAERPDFPAAVGVAHPCIETWLLADARAIQKVGNLSGTPSLPAHPESLPAPRQDRAHNPKTVLAAALGIRRHASADGMGAIVKAVHDLSSIREKCTLGFSEFASEVEQRIKPMFA